MYVDNHCVYKKKSTFLLGQTEHNNGGNESIILIHLDGDREDTPENIHLPSVIDEESSDVEKMENIFSSCYTQKNVS